MEARLQVPVQFGETAGGFSRAIPSFPEARERRLLDVLLLFYIAFGGGALGLPILAERGARLCKKLGCGRVFAAFPGQVAAQEKAARDLGIGL